jgi:hypothetical protein
MALPTGKCAGTLTIGGDIDNRSDCQATPVRSADTIGRRFDNGGSDKMMARSAETFGEVIDNRDDCQATPARSAETISEKVDRAGKTIAAANTISTKLDLEPLRDCF